MKQRFASIASDLNWGLGTRFGLSAARWPLEGSLDRELRRLVDRFGVGQILDVGAHRGGFGQRLRRNVRFSGKVISFEPSSESFDSLTAAANADGNWVTRDYGLGSSDEIASLNIISGDGQFDSLHPLSTYAASYQSGIDVQNTRQVTIHRLDTVWNDLGGSPTDTLLKTDTQGHDLEVLEGAGVLLSSFPVVLMEVAVTPIYEGAPILNEVLDKMSHWGFEITGAFPIHRHAAGARVLEFDCTFVNLSAC